MNSSRSVHTPSLDKIKRLRELSCPSYFSSFYKMYLQFSRKVRNTQKFVIFNYTKQVDTFVDCFLVGRQLGEVVVWCGPNFMLESFLKSRFSLLVQAQWSRAGSPLSRFPAFCASLCPSMIFDSRFRLVSGGFDLLDYLTARNEL